MNTNEQLDITVPGLIASPEAAAHTEFMREAVRQKGSLFSDTKEAKASKGRQTPAPSPLFEQPVGGEAPAPTKAPTLPQVSLPSARPQTVQKTKQPTVEKTKQPTIEKTKQPTIEKTKRPTVEKTKGKGSGDDGGKAPSPTKAPSSPTKGKTSKGEGKNGGDKGKKGDSEVPEDGTAGGEVTGGDSFLGKFN
jgi:hypothetical protein